MRDSLKNFVQDNRDDFDIHEPPDIWKNIELDLHKTFASGPYKKFLSWKIWVLSFGLLFLMIGFTWYYLSFSSEEVSTKVDLRLLPQESILAVKSKDKSLLPNHGTYDSIPLSVGVMRNREVSSWKAKDVANTENNSVSEEETIPAITQFNNYLPNETVSTNSRIDHEVVKDDSLIVRDTIFYGASFIKLDIPNSNVTILQSRDNSVKMHTVINYHGLRVYDSRKNLVHPPVVMNMVQNDITASLITKQVLHKSVVRHTEGSGKYITVVVEVPVNTSVDITGTHTQIKIQSLVAKSIRAEILAGEISILNTQSDANLFCFGGEIVVSDFKGKLVTRGGSDKNIYKNIVGDLNIRTNSEVVFDSVQGNIFCRAGIGVTKYRNIIGNVTHNGDGGVIEVYEDNKRIYHGKGESHVEMSEVKGKINVKVLNGNVSLKKVTTELFVNISHGDFSGEQISVLKNAEFNVKTGSVKLLTTNSSDDFTYSLRSKNGKIQIKKSEIEANEGKKLTIGRGAINLKCFSKGDIILN